MHKQRLPLKTTCQSSHQIQRYRQLTFYASFDFSCKSSAGQFEPGIRDVRFRALRDSGVFRASHFSVAGRWKTLAELTDPEGSYCLDFLRASQLHHFLRTMSPPPCGNPHSLTPRRAVLRHGGPTTRPIHFIYHARHAGGRLSNPMHC